jgi:WD40 repeat protein
METLEKDNISFLITGDYLGKIKIFSYTNFKLLISINSHCKTVNSLDIDSKKQLVISGSSDTYLNVW